MAPHTAPFAVPSAKAPAIWSSNKRANILATGAQTNYAFSMIHERYYGPEKQGLVWLEQDATFYLLRGSATVSHSSQQESLEAGDVVFIPRLTIFQLAISEPDAEVLIVYAPAGPEQLELLFGHRPPAKAKVPAPPAEDILSLAQQYGVHLLPDEDISSTPGPSPSPHQLSIHPQPFKTNASTAPAFWVQPQVPELWTVLVSALQTNNAFTLTEISFDKGHAAGPLKYQQNDEAYYILSGNASVLLNDRQNKVAPGDFVFIPRGTVFGVDSESNDFVALTLHTPSGIIEGALPLLGGVPATERRLPKSGDLPARQPPSQDALVKLGAQMRILGIDPIKTSTS